MISLVSFNMALKTTWINKYLDKDDYGKRKISLTFTSNVRKKDTSKYIHLSDPFLNPRTDLKFGAFKQS